MKLFRKKKPIYPGLKTYCENRHITQNEEMEKNLEELGLNISKTIDYKTLEWLLLKKKNKKD